MAEGLARVSITLLLGLRLDEEDEDEDEDEEGESRPRIFASLTIIFSLISIGWDDFLGHEREKEHVI